MIAAAAVVAVAAGAIGLGVWGVRLVRTTSDLYVASRAITPWWNAAAISGEYLSAASFLGIAGLGMKLGASVLWLPLGFAAGYLALLFFVAAPCAGSARTPFRTSPRLGCRARACGSSPPWWCSRSAASTSFRSSRAPGSRSEAWPAPYWWESWRWPRWWP